MRKASKQLIALCLGAWGVVYGQTESRTSLIEAARTEKEANLTPETEPKLERKMVSIENSLPYRLITGESGGLSVGFGNVMPGAGFAAGPQYTRTGLWKGRLNFSVEGRASINRSYVGRTDISLSEPLWRPRISGFQCGPSQHLGDALLRRGPDSRKTGRSDYRLEDTNVELRPAVRVYKGLRSGLIGSYLANNVGPGHSSQFISSEQQFDPKTAPGIDRQTNFWRGGGFVEYDWRDQAAYPTKGGKYSAQYVRYLDRNLGAYSFLRLDLDAAQYFPLFNGTRVFSVHGSSSLTTAGNGQLVPYLQPTLGGANTLRGYRFNRFYGDNSVMVNGEYRWFCTPTLDMAAFVDAGKVFQRWEQWNLHKLQSDVGFSVRFKNRTARPAFSLDTGFSHEGFQIWFRVNTL